MATVDRTPSSAPDLPGLKAMNMHRVLGLFLDERQGPHTQATIARATDLAPATVNGIVQTLLRHRVLTKATSESTMSDDEDRQRGQALTFAPEAGYVVGVDIGNTHVSVAISDASGRLMRPLWRTASRLYEEREIDLEGLRDHVRALITDQDGDPLAMCIGLPTPVVDDLPPSKMLRGWEGSLQDSLRAVFEFPLMVENDANLGALGEHRLGAARDANSSIFVKVSSGIGAGIVIGGDLWRGTYGVAGEIGHLSVDEHGALCECGNTGCLEVEMRADFDTVFGRDAAGQPPTDEEIERDVAKQRAVDSAGYRLGRGVAQLTTALDPEIIVVGGAWTRLGERFLKPVRRGLQFNSMSPLRPRPVVFSDFGENSVIRGATVAAADWAIEKLAVEYSGRRSGADDG